MATNPLTASLTAPFTAAWSYLRGDDLKVRTRTEEKVVEVEKKLFIGTTVWAPEYTPYLQAAFGGGNAGDYNSAVFAVLMTICKAYMDAPLRVFQRRADEREEWLGEDDGFQRLVDDPHPSLTQPEVMFWVQYAKLVEGNAYLRKIRSGRRTVVQLWPISPTTIKPVTSDEDANRGVFISRYERNRRNGEVERIPVEDIVHFRLGVDDRDHRLGLSPMKRLIREIASDDAATAFADALLKNYAIPGLVVTVPPGPTISKEDADKIKERVTGDFGSGNQGKVAVVANGATMAQIGFSPQQMDLQGVHRLPEERIAAVFGPAPMTVGLGAGLEHSIYNNYREAREALYEQTVIPLWQADAATWQKQLLRPDFTEDRAVFVKYDLTDVRALQPDMNQIYARLSVAIEKGWIKRNEARSEVGLPPVPGWDEEDEAPAPALPAPGTGRQQQDDQEDDDQNPPKRLAALQHKAQALGAIPGLLDVVHDLAQPAFERDVAAYLAAQKQRVRARLTG